MAVPVSHELILGGARSGKSRCAEHRAADWLAVPGRSATLLATAYPGDDEMRERIARHRQDRARRVPALATVEVGPDLGQALRLHTAPGRLLVVDCLTLWVAQQWMPLHGPSIAAQAAQALEDDLILALQAASGPVVLVSNELGMGVMPLGQDVRACVDALGRLHQRVARVCTRVTLMVAGLEMAVKS